MAKVHPIFRFRSARKMTLQQFGELIGVGKAAVFKWEAGINIPSPENAKLIERATDGAVKKGALRPDLWGRS